MQRELITFHVAGQLFGLDIMDIREIRAWSPVTRLPHVPAYVAGVVNLRGSVLPVFDLAARLGWSPTEATPRNPIIVIDINGKSRGLIVDSVNDIVSIPALSLQQPDASGHDGIIPFIEGLAPLGEDMVIVLNLAALSADEQPEIKA